MQTILLAMLIVLFIGLIKYRSYVAVQARKERNRLASFKMNKPVPLRPKATADGWDRAHPTRDTRRVLDRRFKVLESAPSYFEYIQK